MTYACLSNHSWNHVHTTGKTIRGSAGHNQKRISSYKRYQLCCQILLCDKSTTVQHNAWIMYIKPQLYLNQCEGEDEAIPVTVLLVAMYTACYTFQKDNRKNLLLLALKRLDLHGGAIANKSLFATLSML